jgi:hypothetical protein
MNVTKDGIKEGRIHCCGNGCCQRDNAEHEGYDRAPTVKRITENNVTNTDRKECGLLEQIVQLHVCGRYRLSFSGSILLTTL